MSNSHNIGRLENLNRNSIINTAGMVGRFALGILSVPILVRVLGLKTFGEWALLQSIVSLAGLAEFGISSALAVRYAQATAVANAALAAQIRNASFLILTLTGLLSAVVLVVVGLVGPQISTWSTVERSIWFGCLATAPGGLLRLWQIWFVGLETGLGDYATQARVETFSLLLMNLATIVLAFAGFGIAGLALATSVVSGLSVLMHFIVVRNRHRLSPRIEWSTTGMPDLLGFGVRHWLSNLGGMLFTKCDRLVVFAVLGGQGAGYYAACVSIVSRINELSAIPIQPVVPLLSAAQSDGSSEDTRQLFRTVLHRSGAIVTVLGVGVIAWAPFLGVLSVGERPDAVIEALIVMSAIYAGYSAAAPGHYANLGFGRPGRNAILAMLCGVGALGAIDGLGKLFGLAGAAAGNIVYCGILALNFQAGKDAGLTLRELILFHLRVFGLLSSSTLVGIVLTRMHLGWLEAAVTSVVFSLVAIGFGVLIAPGDSRKLSVWVRARLVKRFAAS